MIFSYGAGALSVTCFVSFSWAIAKLFVPPPHMCSQMKVLGFAGVFFSVAQLAMVARARPVPWRMASAPVLYVVALGLFWWAVAHAARAQLNLAFTNATPVTLLVDGPYAYIRHPFYASYLLYWVAGAFVSNWLGHQCVSWAASTSLQSIRKRMVSALAIWRLPMRPIGAGRVRCFLDCASQDGNSTTVIACGQSDAKCVVGFVSIR